MKNSFVLYHDYKEHFSLLPKEELADLIIAIFDYEINGDMPIDLSAGQRMAFSFIKRNLDTDRDKYEKICEKRKNAGSAGGKQRVANQAR